MLTAGILTWLLIAVCIGIGWVLRHVTHTCGDELLDSAVKLAIADVRRERFATGASQRPGGAGRAFDCEIEERADSGGRANTC